MSRDNPAKLLEDPQSLNLYAYARNNPLKYVDPSGEVIDTAIDAGITTYDAGRTAKNWFETTFDGASLMWNLYVSKDYEAAAKSANKYDKNFNEYAESLTDFGIDATATAIPFVPAGLSKVGRAVDKEKGSIVIGENMARVTAAGKKLNAKTFQGSDDAGNIEFIDNAIKKGDKIFDIGPDFQRRAKRLSEGMNPGGHGYNLERELLKNHGAVTKLWERTGKYIGITKY